MAEIMRMRKILVLITSVGVEIQLYKNVHWTFRAKIAKINAATFYARKN